MTSSTITLLTFSLDELCFAIPVEQVGQIIRAVEVTSVPDTHKIIHGVINIHGEIVPVINLRERFKLPDIPVTPEQRFMVVHTPDRSLILVVDEVHEVISVNRGKVASPSLPPSEGSQDPGSRDGERHISLNRFFHHDRSVTILYDLEILMDTSTILHINEMEQGLANRAADER